MMEMEQRKNKYLKTVAKIPAYVACARERHMGAFHTNENGHFEPLQAEAEQKAQCLRSDVERVIFIDKFLQFPKDFCRIAQFLTSKTTRDCVAYYYATKKTIPYKELLREQLLRRRGKPSWAVMRDAIRAIVGIDVRENDLGARCSISDFDRAIARARGHADPES